VCSLKTQCGGTASSTHVPSSGPRRQAANESAAYEWGPGQELTAMDEEGVYRGVRMGPRAGPDGNGWGGGEGGVGGLDRQRKLSGTEVGWCGGQRGGDGSTTGAGARAAGWERRPMGSSRMRPGGSPVELHWSRMGWRRCGRAGSMTIQGERAARW
jgi:hypothetical protein